MGLEKEGNYTNRHKQCKARRTQTESSESKQRHCLTFGQSRKCCEVAYSKEALASRLQLVAIRLLVETLFILLSSSYEILYSGNEML